MSKDISVVLEYPISNFARSCYRPTHKKKQTDRQTDKRRVSHDLLDRCV